MFRRQRAGQDRPPAGGRAGLACAIATALVLTACTGNPSSPGSAATPGGSGGPVSHEAPKGLRVEQKLDVGLQLPWSVIFLPGGTALVSERDSGMIKSIRQGKAATVGQLPGVVPGGEGGLLGLAPSPTFASDHWLYAYLTATSDNRIVRVRLKGDADGSLALGETEVIFSGIPKASTHNGGRIRFGPDGLLYVGTGDSQRRDQPQDPSTLGGKILRLTPDGRPARGNPFGDDNPVYSYGHRNVQGLAWDSGGRLWASEFGPDVDDELNLITPGGNYGWPTVTGAPGRKGFIDAKVVWPSTSDASPSGLEILDDVAYTGALRGQRLWAIPLEGEATGAPVAYFTGEYGRLRDVAGAPDGTLWVISNNKNPDFALILRP
ncbi:PQQ-dependent sugar dehydrogenase [Arthrobacter sp. LFS091]|uniref:PQQ-dependent sugar dehydrogenase n=1 Tax=Arthrobacter sp. LFS091 TaxID=3229892 RepID=UPI003A7FBE92